MNCELKAGTQGFERVLFSYLFFRGRFWRFRLVTIRCPIVDGWFWIFFFITGWDRLFFLRILMLFSQSFPTREDGEAYR